MECILVAYSEIWLKSERTRRRFERMLINNIRKINEEFDADINRGRIFLLPKNEQSKKTLIEKLRFVFGISHYALAQKIELSDIKLDELGKIIANMYEKQVKNKLFRITARRKGRHAFNSMDVQKVVGEHVKKKGGKVSLKSYDMNINVEIINNTVYVYDCVHEGPKGLPLGSEGKVLVLFSGGIDSPVASWYVMKRGCIPSFLFINLGEEQNLKNVYKVYEKLTQIWCPGLETEFIVVDGRALVENIKKHIQESYAQVILKKAFYTLAKKVHDQKGMEAVVTGESIGQVSTQTIKNLGAIQNGIDCLFIRPLIGMDKNEVIEISKKIGTYDASTNIGELCNISNGAVKTAARKWEVEKEFKKVKGWLDNVTIVTLKQSPPSNEKKIPKEHIIINIDKQNINVSKLNKNKFYVIICKEGIKSMMECEKLRLMGFKCAGVKKSKINNI